MAAMGRVAGGGARRRILLLRVVLNVALGQRLFQLVNLSLSEVGVVPEIQQL